MKKRERENSNGKTEIDNIFSPNDMRLLQKSTYTLEAKFCFYLSMLLLHDVVYFQRASTRATGKKPQFKSKFSGDGRGSRDYRVISNGDSISNRNNKSNGASDEWKSISIIERKKHVNSTNVAAQQQCKTKATGSTGPTSPTEASVAPIYYNGHLMDSRNGKHCRCFCFYFLF